MYKLVVFIPTQNLETVKENLFRAGAGRLGNYSHCSFESSGLGQFKPLLGANPSLGQVDKIENVEEIKFETLVDENCMEDVIKSLYKSHPYEEPAFDIIKLENNKFSHLKTL